MEKLSLKEKVIYRFILNENRGLQTLVYQIESIYSVSKIPF